MSTDRKAAIGLATCKKERLIGLHGPANGGGVVVTRLIKWPGGELFAPSPRLSTDNAAMVAWSGRLKLEAGLPDGLVVVFAPKGVLGACWPPVIP